MQTREQYQERFTKVIERLNPEQRVAVDTTEGPVLVIAGPGTGKTHILGARIGQILQQTDTDASNILCLTFSDAGATAMRERLISFIGPDAYRVHIFTFHSFCNAVIQDNLELFGKQELEPINELERVELIRSILDELKPDHPLRQQTSDPYFYEAHLGTLFQQMKAEGWPLAFVQNQISAYLSDIPNRETFRYKRKSGSHQKGDLKVAQLQDETTKMKRLSAAVDLFPVYEHRKTAARRYDYNDMIQWVLEAFSTNESLLRQYQEKFLYLLIDEFQDTNGAQNELINLLAAYWDIPNLFIVGDDDQSIYEFQGARLKNVLDFYTTYRDHLTLVILQQNYRSTQQILDLSGQLIAHNDIRILEKIQELDREKKLRATGSTANIGIMPKFVEYANATHEITDIVRQIEISRAQGVALTEIAIIYARHRQAESLIRLLEQKRIPYQTRKRINVLDLTEIRQFRTLLEWVNQELNLPGTGDQLLFRLLHFDFWGIHLPDLLAISLERNQWIQSGRAKTWRQLISDEALLLTLPLKRPKALEKTSQRLEQLLVDAVNVPLPDFAERLLNRTGMLERALAKDDPTGQVEVLATFWNFLQSEARRTPRITLDGFLAILDRMEANHLGLDLEKAIDTHQGVQLITAHSAKGLEFDRVFLIDCVRDYWEPRNQRSRYQFPLPDTLTLSGEEDAMEARRRLFYVAMTRARTHLHISYGRMNEKGQERIKARFLDELLVGESVSLEKRIVPADELLTAQRLLLRERPNPIIAPHHGASVSRVLNGFALSVSALNSYLYCPLAFYFDHVLRVPRIPSERAAYGTAAHQALYRLFHSMNQSRPKQFPGQKQFIALFQEELNRFQYQFVPEVLQRLSERGVYRLGGFYQYNLGRWNRRVVLEYTIRQVEVEGVPITGTIDKLEFLPKQEVRLVDYKTGEFRAEKLRRPSASSPEGGSYWRQLSFYKILYDAFDQQGHICRSGAISYLDPDAQGQYREELLEFEVSDRLKMKEIIVDVYDKIQKHQFYEGCGQPRCKWCQFVNHAITPNSFHNFLAEEMDDQ